MFEEQAEYIPVMLIKRHPKNKCSGLGRGRLVLSSQKSFLAVIKTGFLWLNLECPFLGYLLMLYCTLRTQW
jgi:hypothetical protein